MPELPEIEIVHRDLEREVVGRRVKEAEVRPGSNAMKIIKGHGRRKEFTDLLVGAKIEKIGRVGRRLLLELDTGNVLVVGLNKTGQLLKTSASEEMASHTHVLIDFTIGGQLRIIDPTHLSEVQVVPKADLEKLASWKSYTMDPLETPVPWQTFSTLLQSRREALKDVLMDEEFIVGLGDIYSDEILFEAGLRHDRLSHRLSFQDVRRLYRALMETLQESVKARGTSWGTHEFKDLQGAPGQYQLELKVFERTGEPCRRCRSAIVSGSFNGHQTYFCPQCQA
jgi:formamidopyrimidine-DNA glycosylase